MEEAAAEAKKAEGALLIPISPILLEEQLDSMEIIHSTYYILMFSTEQADLLNKLGL